MDTSMKKLEIYTSVESCGDLTRILEEEKLYWYSERVKLRGEEPVCKVTVYAPIQAIEGIVSKASEAMDLRRSENMIIVSDVEAGVGAPYRITGLRFLSLANAFTQRPRFMLLEDANERSRVASAQILLAGLAGSVALAGLVTSNAYVIIGAMLLSPILGPIYAFSVLAVLSRPRGALRSLLGLFSLLGAALVASAATTVAARILGYEPEATSEILLRARFSWDSIAVPVVLGMASLLAVSSNVTEALTGVAIAAAIIPPASALGWALVSGAASLASGIAANLCANVLGLLMGSYVMGVTLMRGGGRRRSLGGARPG